MSQHFHFDTIEQYFAATGREAPNHPLFAVTRISPNTQFSSHCAGADAQYSGNFYMIALKKVISGEIVYGKNRFDCNSGTMIFMGPNQKVSTQGITVESEGIALLIHPDYLKQHPILQKFQQAGFFSYAVNEALHVSNKEEQHLKQLLMAIEQEYQGNYDEFSRNIVLSHLEAVIAYSERFYRRQFIQRQEISGGIYESFALVVRQNLREKQLSELPSITAIAEQMNVTQRYLTDALKAETGKSAKEWIQLLIIDEAKERLLDPDLSVSTIAYQLGFEYPQYFARLFKNKVGVTPTQYRQQPNLLH
ncbi:AraC family transcriptional regulator [Vibrio sp. SCSIO 43136]|uniref:helix-turn-helix domain-containing protein n=1 Tax=Vibrio sp. SCSIO 43136 TaxID=2819101 RepID=UPI002075F0C7|nr:AraC family transcriptional regulator [Vibrio sp. SCSIO 43136]USD67608.1 AraC family transcriptional regulator [Vibrio sp. SCSIO 43136]